MSPDPTDEGGQPARSGPRTSRRQARTKALELLFAADVRGADPLVLMAQGGWVDDFTRLLVDTVVAHRDAIDELVGAHARDWAVDRMPAVDRTVLRMGTAELVHIDDVPPKVAIDEAVELAKSMSTDASPAFVNGVLAAIARSRGLLGGDALEAQAAHEQAPDEVLDEQDLDEQALAEQAADEEA